MGPRALAFAMETSGVTEVLAKEEEGGREEKKTESNVQSW